MTAPQHDAPPSPQQESSQAIKRQKLQRCWFVGMGLLGGFGFVTSQMSLALAATDFLVPVSDTGEFTDQFADGSATGDSAVNSYIAGNYSTAAVDLAPQGQAPVAPTFEVPAHAEPMPAPEAFIDAPAAPSDSVASFAVETPAAELPVQAAAPSALTQVEAPEATAIENASTVESLRAAPNSSQPAASQSLDKLRDSAHSNPATDRQQTEAAAQPNPGIEIEITPAAGNTGRGVAPTVTTATTPTFTRDTNAREDKPATSKISARTGHPLMGLMEASAMAAPISAAYANSQATLVTNVVNLRDNNGTANGAVTLAMVDSSSLEVPATAEAVPEPLPAAVPDILPAPVQAAPEIVEVEPAAEVAPTAGPTEIVPAALPEGPGLPEEYDSIFVDPTDYSIGATDSPEVVVSEQSTGCEFTVDQSQGVPNGACGLPSAPAPVAGTAGASATGAPVAASQAGSPATPAAPSSIANELSVNVGPVSFSASGIQLSTSAAGREYLNRSVRPLVNLQAAEQFIFPLAVPSPITSLFGFRTHPIFGDYRFHAGTDIGAEQGTPVLATQDGVVAAAEVAGGYGLLVVLRHQAEELELETRYAHLAEIFVEPGEEVKKGEIIGLVGSTGNSTGPHLHFEMRQRTADGWVLVNPDGIVQASLSNLINALNNPMETLTFNLSDFNLSNLRARGSLKAPTTSIPTFRVGEDGIPFRPAQPNAS